MKAFLVGFFGVPLKLLYLIGLCLLLVTLFVGVVLVRITVPRFKLETLSKLGWGASLALVGFFFLIFFLGYLLA